MVDHSARHPSQRKNILHLKENAICVRVCVYDDDECVNRFMHTHEWRLPKCCRILQSQTPWTNAHWWCSNVVVVVFGWCRIHNFRFYHEKGKIDFKCMQNCHVWHDINLLWLIVGDVHRWSASLVNFHFTKIASFTHSTWNARIINSYLFSSSFQTATGATNRTCECKLDAGCIIIIATPYSGWIRAAVSIVL